MSGTATTTFTNVIMAEDKATAILQHIRDRVKGVQRAVEAANTEMAATSTATGALASLQSRVGSLRGAWQGVAGAISGVRARITGVLPMLAGLAVPLSAGGLVALTKSVADATAEMAAMSERTGVGARDLAAFIGAAKLSHVPVEALDGALSKLNKNLAGVATGKNHDLPKIARALHISLRGANGQLRTAGELLPDIAEAMARNGNAVQRAAIGNAFFGKSYAALIPMLQGGREELATFAARMRAVAYIAGPEEKKNLIEFSRSWIVLEAAIGAGKKAIAGALAPVLTPMLDQMAKWITLNREWIATEIGKVVREFGEYLGRINWTAMLEGLRDALKYVRDAVEGFGGLGNVIKALIAIKVGTWAIGLLASLTQITAAATGARTAIAGLGATTAAGAAAGAGGGLAATLAGIGGFLLRRVAPIAVAAEIMRPSPTNQGEEESIRVRQDRERNPIPAARALGFGAREFHDNFRDRDPLTLDPDLLNRLMLPQTPERVGLSRTAPELAARLAANAPPRGMPGSFVGSLLSVAPPPAPAPAPVNGAVDVRIRFENQPPGMTYSVQSSGAAQPAVGGRMDAGP